MSDLNGSLDKSEGLVGSLGTDKSLVGYLSGGDSLTGELGGSLIPGPQGPKGEKGDKGDKGDRGETGKTGPAGPTGERGEKGDTGAQGPRGETGERGPTGETGAQGPQGEIGPAGPKGDTGAKGDTGERGETGPKGDTGEPGPKGDTGPAGPQGLKGDKGDKGDTGATGPIGPAGPQGLKGDTGERGETGPQGLKGDKGDKGDPGDDYILTQQDKEDIASLVDVPVNDVQINGSSVVSDGVAVIPVAKSNTLGLVIPNNGRGVGIVNTGNDAGKLFIDHAYDSGIKSAIEQYRPITPDRQHKSVFYGLAKASGDSTQAQSDNAVGTYTEEAKIAIQKMLGLYTPPWELITDYTTTEDLETVEVITDLSGQPFELTESFIRVYFQPSLTGANNYIKGNPYARKTNNTIGFIGGFPTVRYMANGTATYSEYKQEIIGNILRTEVRTGASTNNTQNVQEISAEETVLSIMGFRLLQYNATSTLIPQGTRILIYGRRKT